MGSARDFIARAQRPDWHTVAAVVLTQAGRQHIGMNLDSILPRASVCAEPIALGMAACEDPDDPVIFCAAINRHGTVIPPCGVCRELMMDYARSAMVAMPLGADFDLVPMVQLMPDAYKSEGRKP